MKNSHYDIYLKYYGVVVDRFYTKAQREKLFGFFLSSGNVRPDTDEYALMVDAVKTIDEENISDYTEVMNYKMLSSMRGMSDEKHLAVSALAKVYRDNTGSADKVKYKSFLEWIITLRTTYPKTDAQRFELAYFNYSDNNVGEAISELEALVNNGNAYAIEHLAFIHNEIGEREKAYYYFSLLESMYIRELKISPPDYISEHVNSLKAVISESSCESIDKDVERITPIIINDKKTNRPVVGFVGNGGRKLIYEH